MEIQTIKISGQGYLLNGTMHVPGNAYGNREYELIKQWIAEGNEPESEFSAEELESQRVATLKQAKTKALQEIVVVVGDKSFDGNEPARLNMMSAIQASELLEVTENAWKLADNSAATVSVVDLKQALALAIQEVGRIVMVEDIEEL